MGFSNAYRFLRSLFTGTEHQGILLKLTVMLAIGLGGVVSSQTLPIQRLEESIGLSTLFRIRQVIEPLLPPDDVVIVEIDRQSSEIFGVTPTDCLKWPRSLDAELVRKLQSAGAALTVFDMVFQYSSLPEDDQALAQAMRQAGNVILAQQFRLMPMEVNGQVYENCERIKSIDLIEREALASAPSPVPELESRDTSVEFAAFDESCGPTLPTVALHLQMLNRDRDVLANLVRQVDPDLAHGPVRGDDVHRLIDAVNEALEAGTASDGRVASLAALHSTDRRFLINHYGPAGSIKTCSIQEILGGGKLAPRSHCRPDRMKGKVVFVGFAKDFEAERNREQFKSPFGKVSMVELIATSYANLESNDAIHPLSHIGRSWLLLLWGSAIGFCYGVFYFPRALAAVAVLSMGYTVTVYWMFAHEGTWLPLVAPVGLQVMVPTVLALISFLMPRAPRKHDALIFASDMQDTVRLADHLSAERLSQYRQGYFYTISKALERHGGSFANQVADDFYGFWEKRGELDDYGGKACATALDISESIELYMAGQSVKTPLRIGLHAGEEESIPCFTIVRKEYRFIGKSSGIASRIENMNKLLKPAPPILMSASALPRTDGFVIRRLGFFLPQGLEEPVEVHHLIGREGQVSDGMKRMLSLFSAALALVEQGLFEEGLIAFRELKQDFPDDGPTDFYLRYLERSLSQSPVREVAGFVRIEKTYE
jgi:adenylate cyclase